LRSSEVGVPLRCLFTQRIELLIEASAGKVGLSFQIVDREHLAEMRRLHGLGVNPWRTGSRFIISHRLFTDEAYVSGLRDVLGEFRARALLVLDEAHHAAPAGGSRYAISSQFTKVMRNISERFEHRLFLSGTPHNGHSNSFSALRCSIHSASPAGSKFAPGILSLSWFAD
jgi:hypothetical protein